MNYDPPALSLNKTIDVPYLKVRSKIMNSLMDVWCDAEPKVCKLSPKGYKLKIEDYMAIMAGETASGIAAILGVVLYLSRKREFYGEIDEFSTEEMGDLGKTTAEALRRYLLANDTTLDVDTINALPLFEGEEA